MFPILSTEHEGRPLIYLDNAASTQKPEVVLKAMDDFYRTGYANIHRGVYRLSQEATAACELSREKIRRFIGAKEAREIVFVRGATEAINLVAASFGNQFLKKGDEILVCQTEHHANIVPWQELCKRKELILKVIPVNDRGEMDLEEYQKLLGPRTYLVAVGHISNALGTIHPIQEIVKLAHHAGAYVLVDGAQSVPHQKIDVQALGCDFFCFSGHKMYGPTGIGVLYGRYELLEKMEPYQTGGDMIESVSFEKTTYAKPPARFEAGTPAIAEIIGLGAAVDFLEKIGMDNIEQTEKELLDYATEKLLKIPGLKIIGEAHEKASLVSFVFQNAHPHDVGQVLAEQGICVRAGHHCAQPTMRRFGVPATTRASFSFYNTKEEIDRLAEGLLRVTEIFS